MNSPGPSKPFTVILALRLLGPLALSWLAEHDSRGRRSTLGAIAHNLRVLEGAKEQWALEHHATNGGLPTSAELVQYLPRREFIEPVAGEVYAIRSVGEFSTARLTRKLHRYEAGTLLTVTNF